MLKYIRCDSLVFQTLEDLKDACTEAGDDTCKVEDYEVGVFCGEYKTPVPADGFERQSNGTKKRKSEAVTGEESGNGPYLIASSGVVNVIGAPEDIRYAFFPSHENDSQHDF